MSDAHPLSPHIATIETYFRKVGAGDHSLLDLFTDDFEFHFPKFGIGRGKADFQVFAERGGAFLESLGHNFGDFRYIVAGDAVVLEGTEYGMTRAGERWPDKQISHGRFCSVFNFDGPLIRRMYIYVDPDFTSADAERVRIFHRGVQGGAGS